MSSFNERPVTKVRLNWSLIWRALKYFGCWLYEIRLHLTRPFHDWLLTDRSTKLLTNRPTLPDISPSLLLTSSFSVPRFRWRMQLPQWYQLSHRSRTSRSNLEKFQRFKRRVDIFQNYNSNLSKFFPREFYRKEFFKAARSYTRSITRTPIIYLIRKETTNFHLQQPFMVPFFFFLSFLEPIPKIHFPSPFPLKTRVIYDCTKLLRARLKPS